MGWFTTKLMKPPVYNIHIYVCILWVYIKFKLWESALPRSGWEPGVVKEVLWCKDKRCGPVPYTVGRPQGVNIGMVSIDFQWFSVALQLAQIFCSTIPACKLWSVKRLVLKKRSPVRVAEVAVYARNGPFWYPNTFEFWIRKNRKEWRNL